MIKEVKKKTENRHYNFLQQTKYKKGYKSNEKNNIYYSINSVDFWNSLFNKN